MAKAITKFVCQQCGYESSGWLGKCPECGEWNSLVETVVSIIGKRVEIEKERQTPQPLGEIKSLKQVRIKTGIGEFDRVLGGGPPAGEAGIVPGSVVLVAGEPGIGKSTLMLQLAAKTGGLYVTGEESLQQIKIRAERLGVKNKDLLFLAEINLEAIIEQLEIGPPAGGWKLVIIDSIQALYTPELSGTAGSVGQVKECAGQILRIAKNQGIPVFLIGHVTKAGAIAGPKVLEHMVDTVLNIEGERFGAARLLRATKNRFGAIDEVGVFEISDKGMVAVDNPSKLFLANRVVKVPGSVVVATMEGTRPVLVEIQALVVPTQLVIPRRIGQGIDYNRLQLIVAVLTKRLNLPLSTFDVYVNVVGGLRIEEPAADLGVALAIVSSFKNIALNPKTVVFGELGLLGELREVAQSGTRNKEAKRLGFGKIISPEKYSSINQAAKELLA
jgi:DNA repair protein RadA/Sms